jgi:predicted nucleic acid-binding protein
VAAKLFVKQDHTAEARVLFSLLETDPEATFSVPDIFYTEVANVLWKYVRWESMPPAEAEESLKRLRKLAITRVETDEILEDAFRRAVRLEIAVYDACYLAVARVTAAEIVTVDGPLLEAAEADGIPALHLRDAVPPAPGGSPQ